MKPPHMDVLIQEATNIKRATGVIRHGAVHITLPKRWNKKDKEDATEHLKRVLFKKAIKEQQLLSKLDQWLNSPEGQTQLITIDTQTALERYVRQLNRETFQVPLKNVRIGQARFSRLAQMNIQTHTMTVSHYCLKGVPEPALRYLIIHELGHLIEANHSKRFWALVAQYVPDYKHQSDVMKAFHKRAVDFDTPVDALSDIQRLPILPAPTAPHLPKRLKLTPIAPERKKEEAIKQQEPPTHLKPWWQLKLF